ncbi:hypothetical protein B0T16DRAFT_451799 [Cercophora newfieldiana]|uniref:Zn(2)-C6 fungal-type domain-containing protein n=1 Tax=Cercophora newfieldiana TaxID=92897 RepID=A0AA40CYE3_9PEZI|nr:hypothetical protein B0T16DRAFT_451799 [Cercophora newfieldiana]
MSPPPPTIMPRRQSCDRCHNQKVRCFTDGPEEIFTPGGTADDEVNLNGHFVSSFPCRRCKKAGALCIFSPPLGTTEVDAEFIVPPRVSQKGIDVHNSSVLPRTTVTSKIDVNLAIASLNAPTQLDAMHLPTGMMTPVSHLGAEDQGTFGSLGPWLTSAFHTNDMAISYPNTPYFSASSIVAAPGPMDYDPSLFTSTSANTSSEVLTTSDFAWGCQNLDHEDYFQELAEIHRRVHSIGRNARPVTPSLSPIPVDEVFETGCSLVSLTDRYTASRRSNFPPGYTSFSTARAVDDGMETSFCLMAMGCHQIILALFQDIFASFADALQHPLSSSGALVYVATSPSEVDAMVKLASHLLRQLDQSLVGLLSVSTVMAPAQAARSPNSPTSSDLSSEVEDVADLWGQHGATAAVFQQIDRRKNKSDALWNTSI